MTTPILIYVGSEILRESAGTSRQIRQVTSYLNKGTHVYVVHCGSVHLVKSAKQLTSIRKAVSIKTNRKFRFAAMFRFLKQDLLLEFLTPTYLRTTWHVYKLKTLHKNAKVFYSSPTFPLIAMKPYIVDQRDPWGLHPTLAKIKWHRRLIEQKVLRNASEVRVAGNYLANQFRFEYDVKANVEYNYCDLSDDNYHALDFKAMKAIDPEFIQDTITRNVHIFTGTMPDNFYNTQIIVERLKTLIKDDPTIVLYMVGDLLRARLIGLPENNIRFRERVPRKLAFSYQKHGSTLLLFGHYFDGYLTAKLFEYLTHKKKILLIDWKEESEAEIISILKKEDIEYEIL